MNRTVSAFPPGLYRTTSSYQPPVQPAKQWSWHHYVLPALVLLLAVSWFGSMRYAHLLANRVAARASYLQMYQARWLGNRELALKAREFGCAK